MNTKLKKILIILIIILIIALAGLLIYNFFIKKLGPEKGGETDGLPQGEQGGYQPPEQEGITPQPEAKIKAISKSPVISPTLTADKTGVIYYHINGEVWKSDFDGSNLTQVSSTPLDNLIKIIWSPDKNKVISIFQDSAGNVTKYFYSYETNKALPLSKYINYIAWSPDSAKISYQYQNDFTDENNISSSNPDGSKYSQIFKTRMKDLIVEWPKGTEIFLREKPSGLVQSSLYSLSTLTKTFTKVIADIYGFSVKWSADGKKLLYSQTTPNGKIIGIYTADRSGSNQKSANVLTLAEKCVWSQDSRIIYCAVPKNIENANVLPDDFYKGTFFSDDDFWKVNIETGEKIKVLDDSEITEIYNATDLLLSPQESYLLFVNKKNGLLYSIKLQ